MAKHWYTKFLPELREVVSHNSESEDPERVAGAEELAAALDELLARPEHAWVTGNLSEEERQKRQAAQEAFKKRYAED